MSQSKAKSERAERAAAVLKEQQQREFRTNVLKTVGVVAALAVLVGIFFVYNQSRDTSGDVTAGAAGSSEYGVTIGEASAPREVIIYEDFLCPFCGDLEAAVGEPLADLAEEGKVLVDYRPYNLLGTDYSEASVNAFAVVLEASSPEVAKEFHDLLYADQPEESGPYPDADWLVDKAVEAGAEEDAVRSGIEDLSMSSFVEDASEAAREAGVQGTPTILLDGEVFPNGRTIEETADNLVAEIG